jgi:hypothetical protein
MAMPTMGFEGMPLRGRAGCRRKASTRSAWPQELQGRAPTKLWPVSTINKALVRGTSAWNPNRRIVHTPLAQEPTNYRAASPAAVPAAAHLRYRAMSSSFSSYSSSVMGKLRCSKCVHMTCGKPQVTDQRSTQRYAPLPAKPTVVKTCFQGMKHCVTTGKAERHDSLLSAAISHAHIEADQCLAQR